MDGLPRLHLITDDEVLGTAGFAEAAREALAAADRPVALHLRGPRTPARTLFDLAHALEGPVTAAGAWLVVNDRVDLAAIVGARGVQLARRGLPLERVKALRTAGVLPGTLGIGVSVHETDEARQAAGADWLIVGTVYPSASHPGRPGRGTGLVRSIVDPRVPPVVAIGGVTPERVQDVVEAGAHGVAVLGGVWWSPGGSTGRAVKDYLEALAFALSDSPLPPFENP